MIRLLTPRQDVEERVESDGRSSGGALRRLLLGVGALAAVYVAFRSAGRSGDADDGGTSPGAASAVDEPGGSAALETDRSADGAVAHEDRSADELEELAADDVRAESPAPGEMAVDEEVVEDVLDGEATDEDEPTE